MKMSAESRQSHQMAKYAGIACSIWAILLAAWVVDLLVNTRAILTYIILIVPVLLAAMLFIRRRSGVAWSVLIGTVASLITAFALLLIFGRNLD